MPAGRLRGSPDRSRPHPTLVLLCEPVRAGPVPRTKHEQEILMAPGQERIFGLGWCTVKTACTLGALSPRNPERRRQLLAPEEVAAVGQRAALYCRVSTADQSCGRQERDLTAYAERHGFDIVGIY